MLQQKHLIWENQKYGKEAYCCLILLVPVHFSKAPLVIGYFASFATMNQTCSPPVAQGGKGYCGPSFCDLVSSTSTSPACVFASKSYDYSYEISKTQSKTCTQSSDARCTSAALLALMVGQGIKAAYCNDAFLILKTDGSTGFQTYLDSIKNPPASVSNGVTCVTRYSNPSFETVKVPLNPTLLSTADPLVNNVNLKSYPNGGADTNGAYMSTSTRGTGSTYGLPTRGNSFEN